MALTWNDLATGVRWRGVVSFIRNWVGPFSSELGMAPDELDAILRGKRIDLPQAVREWYLLGVNWDQGGLNVWIRPEALEPYGGMIGILTDHDGVNLWGIRLPDLCVDDPPVASGVGERSEIAFPSFSKFVAAMIMNDVLCATETAGMAVTLNRQSACAALMCFAPSRFGDTTPTALWNRQPS
jgi:hypothetical protein